MNESLIVEQFDPETKRAAGDGWIRIFAGPRLVARVQYWADEGDRARADKFAADLCNRHNAAPALAEALKTFVEDYAKARRAGGGEAMVPAAIAILLSDTDDAARAALREAGIEE